MNNKSEKGGRWKHICPSCENEFEGRKNRIYCDDVCKAAVNNEKRSERRQRLESTFKRMENNLRLLMHLPKGLLGIKFPISRLTSKGFDPNIPTYWFKDQENGNVYQELDRFRFRVTDSGTHIIIYKFN